MMMMMMMMIYSENEPSAEYAQIWGKKIKNAVVRERTIPTERPPPVGEVSANFCG